VSAGLVPYTNLLDWDSSIRGGLRATGGEQ